MTVAEYLDSIENTDQEQATLAKISEMLGLNNAKEELMKLTKIPVAGKVLKALVALSEAESVAEFKQTQHYNNIKNWAINADEFEKGQGISIQPGPVHKEVAIDIIAMILAVLFGFWLGRKFGKKRCK